VKFQANDSQSQGQSQNQNVHPSATEGTSGVRPPPRNERDQPGTPDVPASPDHPDVGHAHLKPHGKFSWIWMIPIVAGALVIYLAYVNYAKHGPTITVTFSTADGLQVDQTLVKHKAVGLGTVEEIVLAKDMSQVTVKIQMDATAKDIMTDHARFWVVRPRFSAGNLSGLETLVSGAYIEVDPGAPGGKKETHFKGLETPPGRTSDEPGHVFLIKANKLGSLSVGAPVYYRDVEVGELLSYDLGDGLGPVSLRVFVRAPYDKFVHPQTRFWNASGISIVMGSEGMHIELESIQTVISGGLAFETPRINEQDPPAEDNAQFHLFEDKAKADSAFYQVNIPYVTYFETSVQGLSNGAPVQLFGVQIGSVTDVKLVYDEDKKQMVARVAFELQPERILSKTEPTNAAVADARKMPFVDNSVHVVLESSSLLTGAKDLSLVYKSNDGSKSQVSLQKEGDATVLPSQGGGVDNLTAQLSDVATKVNKIPFEDIGNNIDAMTKSFNHLANQVDAKATPALAQLPGIMASAQGAVDKANGALGEAGYGQNSQFQHGLERLTNQMNDAMRNIRVLADYLDRHPEALLRGRSGGEK
jgi:paraquat-inducible protein B